VSLKSELLRTARLARRPLADTAGEVLRYILGRATPEGAFSDRSGKADLYYTVFGLLVLDALEAPPPPLTFGRYLPSFGDGAGLDFAHLSCLARCWSLAPAAGPGTPAEVRRAVLARLAGFRSADGGYAPETSADRGTAYGCFLGLGAVQDLGAETPDPAGLAACLASLAVAGGGYTNEHAIPFGSTPATAAVVTMLADLGRPVPPRAAGWLRDRLAPEGGLVVMPGAPTPDLLSTATGLHALGCAGETLDEKERAACLGFVLGLLTDGGGFRGHWADDGPDCEYTFYGLLALGRLVAWTPQ
jgi:hypothetical protein